MSRITQQLLKKRAQHNDMCLTTLEQVSLHQQDLIKIQNLDVLCRHLKILYLQNNVIEKMENLNKLKELQYLNLALNNISKIQNIEKCESLRKLDLTVNFIDVLDIHQSVICLSHLPQIKQIYLTGNPCEDWKGCKQYVIAHCPTLETYNGEVITPSQRIQAVQNLQPLKADLYHKIQMRKVQLKKQQAELQELNEKSKFMSQEQKNSLKTPYTKEARREIYYQQALQKQKKERQKNPQKYEVKKISQMYNKDGEVRQCNQGKFTFHLREYDDPDYSFFEIEIPKHLQTKELQAILNPKFVSVRVKGKLTQLKLSQQIIVHQSKTERSQITGYLMFTMKKLEPHQFLRKKINEEKKKIKQQELAKKNKQEQQRQKRVRLCQEYQRKMQLQDDQIPDLE